MTGRGDEVEKSVDTVVPEARVTLDTRLLSENVIVLAFEMANDLREAGLVIDLITESRRVHDGQRYASSFLIELELNSDGLDPDTLLEVGTGWVVGVFALEHSLPA